MARGKVKNNGKSDGPDKSTALGFESRLWSMADKLRSNMDAAEYKHVVLGLIFLKFISDKFNAKYEDLKARQKTDFTDPEERDEYVAENVFWVPKGARWQDIQDRATTAEIGQIVDDAMRSIEAENPTLEGVLPKNYARADLDKRLLGEVINLVGKIELVAKEAHHQGNDLLGRTYEYFIGQFAAAEGKRGGQFYTPARVVELLVRMIEPYKGRVYDPCCGSGGMFVQSEKFVEAHGGGRDDLSVYGQESNPQTWRLAKMNLAIRGITANLGPRAADSFHDDLHKDLKADFILANPPFNISDWGGERRRSDVRWKFGAPPVSNANFAWVQHIVHHLAPHGLAGFILANGSLSSNQSGEGEIRTEMIRHDIVDCIVSLPSQLFYTTQIPVCMWFLARDKSNGLLRDKRLRDRRGETLFIDARALGQMETRTLRALSSPAEVEGGEASDIGKIVEAYHAWREGRQDYANVPGFCRAVKNEEIEAQGFVLTPGRYVGAAVVEEEDIPFAEHFAELKERLEGHILESERLNALMMSGLSRIVSDAG
ncbi:Type I restriction-modification system methylation subunit [Granulibacter bethesdensis]|uniref:site-specific DNA-methyltransferase (adenine-specific) n=1 Tax=Granulibacter bethesdensis TaxID=364410 RepID=A0AAC9P8R7_9PROT|nr:class I SAM-dependent DNA methyltransferase [Granulibacter bethesdensis]APH54470.1 Type I restriction-modification system methylation subunit [Granulibacter bethesdensis]APH62056.1 Type I restriction-modification system methylation subunit [Granulibacter bethesdensis]